MEKALLQKIVQPADEPIDNAMLQALISSVNLLLGSEKASTGPNDGREIVRPWQGSGNDGSRSRGSVRGGRWKR
jgi:hypothetical protein